MMIYDHERVIWLRTRATDSQIGDVLRQRDEALATAKELRGELKTAIAWIEERDTPGAMYAPTAAEILPQLRVAVEKVVKIWGT
jgi:hypothetical protein